MFFGPELLLSFSLFSLFAFSPRETMKMNRHRRPRHPLRLRLLMKDVGSTQLASRRRRRWRWPGSDNNFVHQMLQFESLKNRLILSLVSAVVVFSILPPQLTSHSKKIAIDYFPSTLCMRQERKVIEQSRQVSFLFVTWTVIFSVNFFVLFFWCLCATDQK